MSETTDEKKIYRVIAVTAAIAAIYWSVIAKLAVDWWTIESYSHGLLVPFVIAFILWNSWTDVRASAGSPAAGVGLATVCAGLVLLFAGTLGAELFSQRISFVVVAAGVLIYFFGREMLRTLAVPFALMLVAIPVPQIIFNNIALPLQSFASRMAVALIRLADVPTVRKGNVIDILPVGATQTISLEVVEACSGIRSLMTLIAIALLLGFVTREGRGMRGGILSGMNGRDVLRTVILMAAALPIAVITNAFRVGATGYLTYRYGRAAAEGVWHEASGWLVYIAALGLLICVNLVVTRAMRRREAVKE